MNIFEISDKSGISVKRLRVLDKLGVLRHDASTTIVDEMRSTFREGNKLNVAQLVHLVENPAGLLELGRYAEKARAQLEAAKDVAGQVNAAPLEVASQILEAFENQADACEALIAWAKTVIPPHPVGHSYLATRLLLGVPEGSRKHDAARLHRALMNCRARPSFAGWWRKEKSVSRNKTIYEKIALDL